MSKQYYFSKRSLDNLKGVNPILIEFFKELIKISPYDFKITEGVRTEERQKYYYSLGRTRFINEWGEKVKSIVTKCDGVINKSKHQIKATGYGHAVDIAFMGKNTEEMYDIKKFKALIEVARPLMAKYGVFWGGDWKKYVDMPHFQIEEE